MDKEMTEAIRQCSYSEGFKPFVTKYFLTFKCTKCGREWKKLSLTKEETAECRFGCSNITISRLLIGLISWLFKKERDIYGVGELINSIEIKDSLE